MSVAGAAFLAAVAGFALAIAGVYLLAGLGWGLLSASVPLFVLSVVIIRGMSE